MIVEHSLTIVSRCPVNDARDEYHCTVRTDRVIAVEDILHAVQLVTTEPTFQETLTNELAALISAEVETVGVHSGVKTTCRCG